MRRRTSPGVSVCALAPIGTVTTGTWQHVAMTWDGATEQVWVGGSSVASMPTTTLYDGGSITIGADIDSGFPGYFFAGTIDDLQIYDRALSTTELAELAAR
jgi:hypothetical protein